MNRRHNRTSRSRRVLILGVIFVLLLGACGPSEEGGLAELQLIGVDFELNSIIIANNGSTDIRTEGLWAHANDEDLQFDIFTIEPRATVLFNMRELGELDPSGGDISLSEGEHGNDPQTMLQYVAWGDNGFEPSEAATEAGLWPSDDTVMTSETTIVLIRSNPTGNGPETWEASDEVG